MNQLKIIFQLLFLIFAHISLVSGQDLASKDKFLYYLNEAKDALRNNDPSYACDLYSHSLSYAQVVDNGKYYPETKKLADKVCLASLQKTANDIKSHIENHPLRKECPNFNQAKQSCASAGNYDKCMSIRFGAGYKTMETSLACI